MRLEGNSGEAGSMWQPLAAYLLHTAVEIEVNKQDAFRSLIELSSSMSHWRRRVY